MLTLSKMLLNKKSIQNYFKFFIQALFKTVYGKIKGKVNPETEKDVEIKKVIVEKNLISMSTRWCVLGYFKRKVLP